MECAQSLDSACGPLRCSWGHPLCQTHRPGVPLRRQNLLKRKRGAIEQALCKSPSWAKVTPVQGQEGCQALRVQCASPACPCRRISSTCCSQCPLGRGRQKTLWQLHPLAWPCACASCLHLAQSVQRGSEWSRASASPWSSKHRPEVMACAPFLHVAPTCLWDVRSAALVRNSMHPPVCALHGSFCGQVLGVRIRSLVAAGGRDTREPPAACFGQTPGLLLGTEYKRQHRPSFTWRC